MSQFDFSSWPVRSQILCRRSYNRPLDDEGVEFETWEQTIERVIRHQRWLWERAKGKELSSNEAFELEELRALMLSRQAFLAGRTLWLGGTELSRTRESCNFNCAGQTIKTVFDVVDAMWLLLQGVGVGFTPIMGVLNGFMRVIPEIEVVRSTRTGKGGAENNTETWVRSSKTWILQVGDSAKAWAKAIGKLVAGKYPANKLILDLTQIRPAGDRLRGYGWISSGDEQLCKALLGICAVMNRAAGRLLTEIDILDVVNWLGTVLSSRRSAELALLPSTNPRWREFALAKKNHFDLQPQRAQSNNSLCFYEKPYKSQLYEVFDLILESGGSEPGIVNGGEALRRAPYFRIKNPCSEILLGDHGFCNLAETVLPAFNGDFDGLCRAVYLLGRANYRQTCVNLNDGVLQRTWHELNEYLHLCGVGLTGFVQWEYQSNAEALQRLRTMAHRGANSMADELDLPRPALVTTVKPSGTLGKLANCTEGVHKPLGRFMLNNVNFSVSDPLVDILRQANYHVFENPYDSTGAVVSFPVEYPNVNFDNVGGVWVNKESAVTQLDRYLFLMNNYVDHNVSCTISYSPQEVSSIVEWLHKNWDHYVATAFMPRIDPLSTAEDLGYPYLPQEVITEKQYQDYCTKLLDVTSLKAVGLFDVEVQECRSGMCPVR